MPRLTLWKKTKTNDYYFFDNLIKEQFEVGGTGAYIHKYLGPASVGETGDPAIPNHAATNDGIINETKIQDLLLMENRDRIYDKDIYELRGVYNVSDNDFDLTQFGLFLSNDTLFMTFHINAMIDILGRRLMSGDVIELPHLLDENVLDANMAPVPKYYVVQDANRGTEGFSQTWMPHIWRVKLGPITDSQEFSGIVGDRTDDDSLVNILSTYNNEMHISNTVVAAAEAADPNGTVLTTHLFGVPSPSFDPTSFDWASNVPSGSAFPDQPNEGDHYIRSDFVPNRLFVRRGSKWHRLYDNVEGITWAERTYNASTFIENKNTTIVSDNEFSEKQNLSQMIKPTVDFGDSE
jgi:hypothetical protein